MKNLFKSNWFLMGISLFSAIIIWIYVVYQISPVFETSIKNVPITFSKYSEDFDNGKLTVLSTNTDAVTVKVKGKRGTLAKLTRDRINCSVNMSDITKAGTHKIPIMVSFDVSGVELVSKDPYNVSVVVDKVVTEEVDITVQTKGTPAQGYIYDSIEYSVDKIRLTGAKSVIDKVRTARIGVDITGKTESQSGRYKIVLLDKNGEEISDDGISKNISYVELKCNILKLKAVKVNPVLSDVKTYAGHKVAVSKITPEEINVLGSKNAVTALEKLDTKKINVRYAKDGDKIIAELEEIPENIRLEQEIEKVEVVLEVKKQ